MSANEHKPGAQAPGRGFNLRRAFGTYPIPVSGQHAAGGGWLHPDTRRWLDTHARADWHKGDGHVAQIMSAVVSGISVHLDVAPVGASHPLPSAIPGHMGVVVAVGGMKYSVEVMFMEPCDPLPPVLEPEARGGEVVNCYPFPQAVRDAHDGVKREPVSAQPVDIPAPPVSWNTPAPRPAFPTPRARLWDSLLWQVAWRTGFVMSLAWALSVSLNR